MSLPPLPPLREAVAAHGLFARKRFGQHFLYDLNVTGKTSPARSPAGPSRWAW
jgi:16S rRNA (adenine1518-N6/adenine1519-N6)-dimethyltransferase